MFPNHRRRTYVGSPQRHWIYTGPLVIVSAALDAFYTDGIGVNTADNATEKGEELTRSYGLHRGTHINPNRSSLKMRMEVLATSSLPWRCNTEN